MPSDPTFAIQTCGLTRTIGDFSLSDVQLHVPDGALCAVLGAPGSGKTMLVKLLLGLEQPNEGQCMIFGQTVTSGKLSTRLGYVPQISPLSNVITVQDALHHAMILSGHPFAKLAELQQVLTAVRLRADLGESVGSLSLGQRRCLHLAVALIGDPQLLLLDDPAATLSYGERHEFLDTVRAISAGRTVIYTTANPKDVHYASDYLIIMHEGRVVAHGKTADLIANLDTALYQITICGETSTVHNLLAEQSWIHSIQVHPLPMSQKWIVCVRDEHQAERGLLRAILADRNLSVLDFKKLRGRLADFIATDHTHPSSHLPSSN